MSEYSVYVLEATASTGRVTVHVGIAKDVPARILQHHKGKVTATKGRKIKWLGNSAPMPHGVALALEASLKKLPPAKKRSWAADQRVRFVGMKLC